jgi:prepilin peptidase dependent protein A
MLVMFTALRHTPGMKKENGFTLIETLVAVSLVVILSASGLYGWDSWQRHQRLWQTASQVRDYLLFLRNHANRHNRDHQITRQRVGDRDCLVSSAVQGCEKDSPFVLLHSGLRSRSARSRRRWGSMDYGIRHGQGGYAFKVVPETG